MREFSTRELEKLCAVKAHTLRVWEQRYALVQPRRLDGVRRYSLDELEKLLLVSVLQKSGVRISALSQLNVSELKEQCNALRNEEERKRKAVCDLILYMYRMQTEEFEHVLDDSFLWWPAETVVNDIIFPFLQRVNLLCQGKRLNEEHLVVTAVRKKLLWSIERLAVDKKRDSTILLFLPGERQLDLLLLYACFVLKADGWNVIYMGADVSLQNVQAMLQRKSLQAIFTYLPRRPAGLARSLGDIVNQHSPATKLVLAVADGETRQGVPDNVTAVRVDDVATHLRSAEVPEAA